MGGQDVGRARLRLICRGEAVTGRVSQGIPGLGVVREVGARAGYMVLALA